MVTVQTPGSSVAAQPHSPSLEGIKQYSCETKNQITGPFWFLSSWKASSRAGCGNGSSPGKVACDRSSEVKVNTSSLTTWLVCSSEQTDKPPRDLLLNVCLTVKGEPGEGSGTSDACLSTNTAGVLCARSLLPVRSVSSVATKLQPT